MLQRHSQSRAAVTDTATATATADDASPEKAVLAFYEKLGVTPPVLLADEAPAADTQSEGGDQQWPVELAQTAASGAGSGIGCCTSP
jgi:hypothetical protein